MTAIIDHRGDLLHASRCTPSPDFAKGPIPSTFFVNLYRQGSGYLRSMRYATREAQFRFERSAPEWLSSHGRPAIRLRVTMKRPA